jgi:hypothetical protein
MHATLHLEVTHAMITISILHKEFWSAFGAAVFTSTLVSICWQDQKQVHMLLNLVICVSIAGGPKISLYILIIKEDLWPPPVADAMPDLNLVNIGTRESLTV